MKNKEYIHPLTGEKVKLLKNGEPCIHKGCSHHTKHPCEICHRTNAQGEAWAPVRNQGVRI